MGKEGTALLSLMLFALLAAKTRISSKACAYWQCGC